MRSDDKISLLYASISLGILTIAFVLFSVVVSIRISTIYKDYLPSQDNKELVGNVRNDVLFQIGWMSAIFLCISGVSVYLIGKRYSAKMAEQIDRAYQSEKAFISNASHEVNNPLTAIQGECEISLMKERTPGEYQAALRRIASETKRTILLMKHLLFLSHGEKEMLNSSTEPIRLANLLMNYAQGRVHFSMDNFELTIDANQQLLMMALDNIIGNACKYSPDNEPVYLDLRGTVLEISDNGIGIPAEELKNVYQLFYRASNSREFAGNGIGLNLAIRIFNFYGAKVHIHSEEGKGTTIAIDFLKYR